MAMEYSGQQQNDPGSLSAFRPSLELLKQKLGSNNDIIFRQIYVNAAKPIPLTLVFAEGVVDHANLSDYVIKPLVSGASFKEAKTEEDVFELVKHGAIYYSDQSIRENAQDTIDDILTGGAAILFEKSGAAVTFVMKGFARRAVSEPSGENILKGAKDSLVESISTNIATVRSKLGTPELQVDMFTVGRQTKTKIGVFYIKGLTNAGFVQKITDRIKSIDISEALSISHIEDFLKDTRYTLFPQFSVTERPEKVCADLAEGRVCVIIDGIPYAVVAPGVLACVMQGAEDYSMNPIYVSLTRFLRYFFIAISLLLPALFVALNTFHPEMLPNRLVESIANDRQMIPFNLFLEALITLFSFEVLIEAGLRLPKVTGQAVTIIGAFLVGTAAVAAKLIASSILIVVAISFITSFVCPNKDLFNAVRIWRIVLTIAGGIIGLIGVTFAFFIMMLDLARIEVLGVPYLAPFAGEYKPKLQDTLMRLSARLQNFRPSYLKTSNRRKEDG
ncbi:MAG: spore germination protein [Bacillota bacterium]|nr:spore germination protein [Bacillota bacterium]